MDKFIVLIKGEVLVTEEAKQVICKKSISEQEQKKKLKKYVSEGLTSLNDFNLKAIKISKLENP